MKIFALFVEPANYTLDDIKNVHSKLDVEYAFIYDYSKANSQIKVEAPVLSKIKKGDLVRYVWRTLREYDAFIINGYTNKVCLLFLILDILFFKKPYAIDSDTELRIPRSFIKRFLKTSFLRFLFGRQYAYGFAGGRFDHVKLFTHYGMNGERVFVDPMVVDNTRYEREQVQFPVGTFTFGYLGRLVPIKQVDKVIDAVRKLTDDGLNVRLEIVGDGELRAALEDRAKGIEAIKFLGAKFGDEKVASLHRFDALILYSKYEPWGLVVNEALSAGIPCIVSDKVGARNDLILGEDPTGLVVSHENINELVGAMKKMVSDKTLWGAFSNAALRRMSVWNYDLQVDNLNTWVKRLENEDVA